MCCDTALPLWLPEGVGGGGGEGALNCARLMGKFVWERCWDISSAPKRLKNVTQGAPAAFSGSAFCGFVESLF